MEVVHPPPDVAVDMAVTEEADLVGDIEEDIQEEEEGKPAEEDTVDDGDDMGTGVDTEDCDDTGCGGCLLVAVAFVLGVGLAADEVTAADVAPLAAAAAGLAEVAACKAADRVGERQIWTGLFTDPPPPPPMLVDRAGFFLGGGREVSGSESLSSSSDSITSSELRK